MMLPYYREFVRGLFVKRSEGADGLMHAAAGCSGEAGEILDHVKKHWVYGKPLNHDKMVEEIGDLLFYTQALCTLLGIEMSDAIEANIIKLNKRYPQGYTDAAAIARADKLQATMDA